MARVDESVEDVGDHVEFGDGHFDLCEGRSVVTVIMWCSERWSGER
jgi:hypothetical protein